MKHKKIERLIQKKLDREIGPDEKRKLDKHLAQCSDCSLFYTEMVQASKSVRQLTEFYPQTDFNARVLAKLGLRRRFAWSKAAYVFAGGWLAAILFFVYSPLPSQVLGRIATSVPALIRLYDKVELVVASLTQVLSPVIKNSFSTLNPVIGLVFSIMFVYFLGKALQKEVKCKA
jgi:anti-sigma factor RsiW